MRLLRAADRGIRVRFLLDDVFTVDNQVTIDGEEVVETTEPLTSGFKRFQAFLLKIVPDSQL
jgi:hypothetical protein